MRKKIFSLLKKIEARVKKGIKNLLIPENAVKSVHAQNVAKWYADEGHETRRFEYALHSNSIVFDIGGFEGQWASDLYARFNCKIYIFEPWLPYAEMIERRFCKNDNIKVFKYGLGSKTEKIGFVNIGDASSSLRAGEQKETVDIVSINEFIQNKEIDTVDLIKINIEGGEYDLLESLIEKQMIHKFKNIQVQFHDFIDHAKERMTAIQTELEKTHNLTYQYEFVWENWELKR